MGVATGCGCKEVYRFPHTTYPYSSCICSFLPQHPYFLFIKKNFFVLVPVLFGNKILCIRNYFFTQYKHTYRRLRASHGRHMKAANNVLYTKHTQTYASYPAMNISCLYDFKERGVDLEIEGVRYIEMHRRPHMYWASLVPSTE